MSTLRMSEAEVRAHQDKANAWRQWPNLHGEEKAVERPEYVPIRERRKRGMNGLEVAFSQNLELRKRAGELTWWAFEPIRIRLADGTFYKPDFVSVDTKGQTEVWETKGLMREAARVRLNVAARLLPWKFWLVKKLGNGFSVNPVSSSIVPCGTEDESR